MRNVSRNAAVVRHMQTSSTTADIEGGRGGEGGGGGGGGGGDATTYCASG